MVTPSKDKRVVVIFGGNGYVGSATANLFEQTGWTVIKASRSALPDDTHMQCDIGDSTSVANTLSAVAKTNGRIDACIHTASPVLQRVAFIDSSLESFQEHMRIAVDGTMHIAKTAPTFDSLRNIVVITSKATDATKLKMGSYPFAKRVQHELCATLADTLPERICIHTIAPGFLPGGLNNDLPKSVREIFAKEEGGKAPEAGDIARIILDICNQKKEYLTSAHIDGKTGIATPFK